MSVEFVTYRVGKDQIGEYIQLNLDRPTISDGNERVSVDPCPMLHLMMITRTAKAEYGMGWR